MLHPRLIEITDKIIQRSAAFREKYLNFIAQQKNTVNLHHLSCANLAHAMVNLPQNQQEQWLDNYSETPKNPPVNIGIVTAYNDMLSAHKPYEDYPKILREKLAKLNASVQVAGGVPAMCDGITQGQPGMELSLFSREVIAQATAVALTHNVFNGVICLGICDKIVPGLLIGALRFGHLPVLFLPSGPMPSGLNHGEKNKLRKQYVAGKIPEQQLLTAEHQCYHTQGTCTFYGTANTNQLMLEFMGLHLPGASFINPQNPDREKKTDQSLDYLVKAICAKQKNLGEWVNEKTLVNAMVGILATGGSTNHTLHLIAIAKAAGIHLTWQDFHALSEITPLLARIYPNGEADINAFHQAGGVSFVMKELLSAGLLHDEVMTWQENNLKEYIQNTKDKSRDETIIRSVKHPFSQQGGIKLLTGNLGEAIVKTSALDQSYWQFKAPAIIFSSQEVVLQAYKQGELNKDCVIVLRGQGPRANGMPELHKLVPMISNLMDQGYRVALLTDGRLSGASGKILAVIHCSPETVSRGLIAKIQTGDEITFDLSHGSMQLLVEQKILDQRISITSAEDAWGYGRELFQCFRDQVSPANEGATIFRFE